MGLVTQFLVPLIEQIPGLYPAVGHVLNWLNSWIGNIGWTMVLFTLILKMVTLPFDFISRRSMKRNTMIQERLKDELETLEKQCKGDKMLYQQKSSARMKKEGYSMGGACLPSLVTLVLFFFILAGLNQFATRNIGEIYNAMAVEYNTLSEQGLSQEEIDERLLAKYDELSPNFLWVKNPWRPDSPWAKPIPTADEMFGSANETMSNGIKKLVYPGNHSIEEIRADYNKVMGPVSNALNGGVNGYLILPILSAAVSFLSQWLMQKMQPPNPGAPGGGMNKIMMIIFPLMMLFFSINYTAAFAVYIICNSLYMTLANILINLVVGKTVAKEFEKKDKQKSASYRR